MLSQIGIVVKRAAYFSSLFGIFSLVVSIVFAVLPHPVTAAGNEEGYTSNNALYNYAPLNQEVTELRSHGVCTPGTTANCAPGPFSQTVTVPDGTGSVSIDVYWVWEGNPGSIQPNEHSWFSAAVNGASAGRVYCQDFGDEIPDPQFCGSETLEVAPGDTLRLTIVHADEELGPTAGSHHQLWVLNWAAAPPPPPDTPTPTDVVQPPPPDTATPTATDVVGPPPPDTPTPTSTDVVSPPVGITPTPTPTVPTGVTLTPTPTDVVLPPAPGASTPTATPPPTLAPPVAGTQPPALIPVTGADSAELAMTAELHQRVFLNWGLGLLGLAIILYGIGRKLKK